MKLQCLLLALAVASRLTEDVEMVQYSSDESLEDDTPTQKTQAPTPAPVVSNVAQENVVPYVAHEQETVQAVQEVAKVAQDEKTSENEVTQVEKAFEQEPQEILAEATIEENNIRGLGEEKGTATWLGKLADTVPDELPLDTWLGKLGEAVEKEAVKEDEDESLLLAAEKQEEDSDNEFEGQLLEDVKDTESKEQVVITGLGESVEGTDEKADKAKEELLEKDEDSVEKVKATEVKQKFVTVDHVSISEESLEQYLSGEIEEHNLPVDEIAANQEQSLQSVQEKKEDEVNDNQEKSKPVDTAEEDKMEVSEVEEKKPVEKVNNGETSGDSNSSKVLEEEISQATVNILKAKSPPAPRHSDDSDGISCNQLFLGVIWAYMIGVIIRAYLAEY